MASTDQMVPCLHTVKEFKGSLNSRFFEILEYIYKVFFVIPYKRILGFYSEHGKGHKLKLYSPLTGLKYKSLVLVLTQIKITCALRGD